MKITVGPPPKGFGPATGGHPIHVCRNGHEECAIRRGGLCMVADRQLEDECVCDTEGYCPSCSVRGVYQRRIP